MLAASLRRKRLANALVMGLYSETVATLLPLAALIHRVIRRQVHNFQKLRSGQFTRSSGRPVVRIAGDPDFPQAVPPCQGQHELAGPRRVVLSAMCGLDPSVWLPAPPGFQDGLVDTAPAVFFKPPYVGPRGWLGIVLDRVSDADPAMYIHIARELVAPKRLRAQQPTAPSA